MFNHLKYLKTSFLLVFLLSTFSLQGAVSAEIETVSPEIQDKIKQSLSTLLPGVVPDRINKTPIPALYEVIFGPRLVYISADGKYLVQGSILDLQTREDLTEPRLMDAKIEAIKKVGEDNMIIYSPEKGTKVEHQVNVFTDIDCGYCRKLHHEMKEYNEAGIEIRYLFYPRAGINSESFKKAEQVWCSKDRHLAMDEAKAGKPLKSQTDCKNPVKDHLLLGELVGVTGTPALILSDGKLIPGYVPAKRLKMILDARKQDK